MRDPLVIGNWKLNGSTRIVHTLIPSLCNALNSIDDCKVVIAPPAIYIDRARKILNGSSIALGAQNIDINLLGAFTGEISADMLKDIGVQYVIIGHSERRFYHHETDVIIAEKFAVLKKVGLTPILCVGETEIEKKLGKTEETCVRELNAILHTLGVEAIKDAVIAYEPVWAIGTGHSATPEEAQKVHKFIRDHIAKHDQAIADNVIIQYGGSVNDKNAAELFAQRDIDGALVGGASLNANSFIKIVKSAAFLKKKF